MYVHYSAAVQVNYRAAGSYKVERKVSEPQPAKYCRFHTMNNY